MRKILRTKTEIHDFEPNINFCTGQPELRQKDAERDFGLILDLSGMELNHKCLQTKDL